MSAVGVTHLSRVRILYKSILRLHRGLPIELKAIGDNYVKDEFKRHRDCEQQFIPVFMNEWTNYAITLAKQLKIDQRKPGIKFGVGLTEEQLGALNEEQITQLYELFEETHKPIDPENPLGENPFAPPRSEQS